MGPTNEVSFTSHAVAAPTWARFAQSHCHCHCQEAGQRRLFTAVRNLMRCTFLFGHVNSSHLIIFILIISFFAPLQCFFFFIISKSSSKFSKPHNFALSCQRIQVSSCSAGHVPGKVRFDGEGETFLSVTMFPKFVGQFLIFFLFYYYL